MRRLIITTIILLIATVLITVVYFKNLNAPGTHTSETMRTIPDNAALVFEFTNDNGFYDIFNGNKLFQSVIGEKQMADLDTLRNQLQATPPFNKFFTGQNVFISLHPVNNTVDLLLTIAVAKGFKPADMDELVKQSNKNLLVTPAVFYGKKAYIIYSGIIKKRFYLLNKEDGIYSGSFSKPLVEQCAQYVPQKDKQVFIVLPDQQRSNSLANLYVNYSELDPLFGLLFTQNKNTDIFKSFRLLPALGVLSLNFKSDVLMFTGFSNIQRNQPSSYLNLFANQQPIANHLKDIFPSTTAYSISFAVSDAKKFKTDLSNWQTKAKLQHEKDSLFNKVKAGTGVNLITEFNQVLGNEFAVITTRYMEKFAIIALTDGSAFKPVMNNISTMAGNDIGQLNYNKLPYFLLGDAFSTFNHPWFIILDNYLILANSQTELKSYYDTYINRKFQSKLQQYNQFDDLVAEKSNVAWYINFKNAQPILKRDMNENFYNSFDRNEPGWKSFYAASYQLIASDKSFYTTFCMNINHTDSTIVKKQEPVTRN